MRHLSNQHWVRFAIPTPIRPRVAILRNATPGEIKPRRGGLIKYLPNTLLLLQGTAASTAAETKLVRRTRGALLDHHQLGGSCAPLVPDGKVNRPLDRGTAHSKQCGERNR